MSMIGQVLSLRRQIVQARLDATQTLHVARTQGDQRRIAQFAGKALAYQTIIDMIDIEFELDGEDADSRGRHSRA